MIRITTKLFEGAAGLSTKAEAQQAEVEVMGFLANPGPEFKKSRSRYEFQIADIPEGFAVYLRVGQQLARQMKRLGFRLEPKLLKN